MLVSLLIRGQAGRAYNLGSDGSVSLRDLAQRIAAAVPRPCAVITGGAPVVGAERYVPDISLAQSEIGLKVAIGLDAAVTRGVAACLAAAAAPHQGATQELAACTR